MNTPANSSFRWAGFVVCCCAILTQTYAGGLVDFLLPRHELQAITVTDFTPAGLQRRAPSPSAPIYYVAVNAGYRDFGGIIAGERMISGQAVNKLMLEVLAKQGYLPARPNQAPDVVLLWTWGTLNAQRMNSPNPGYSPQINDRQILRFLGGDKLGLTSKYADPFPELTLMPGLFYHGGDAQNLIDASGDDYYVAVISAYDINLVDFKHARLLWNTRISCPSRGFWLPDAFPAMLAIASPYIGRETSKPVWVRATERFKPEIKLGDLKVVEYLQNNQNAVVDAPPSTQRRK